MVHIQQKMMINNVSPHFLPPTSVSKAELRKEGIHANQTATHILFKNDK